LQTFGESILHIRPNKHNKLLANHVRGLNIGDVCTQLQRCNLPVSWKKVNEGRAFIQESLERIQPIIDDIERLEHMGLENLAYLALFDQTIRNFFNLLDMEDVSPFF
jgi:hypothetical protein